MAIEIINSQNLDKTIYKHIIVQTYLTISFLLTINSLI